jgi:hypothetical protein
MSEVLGYDGTEIKDQFERAEYIDRLANMVCLKPGSSSLVVGLEGAWGSGKTFIIDEVKKKLSNLEENQPLIVDFAPWLISDLDSLVEGFLVQLGSSIGLSDTSKEAKDAAKKVLGFAELLTPMKLVPGVEPWGTAVETVLKASGKMAKAKAELEKMDLPKKMEAVEESLLKLNQPIVVFIDDADRLPPEQVCTLFQLLKTAGNFKCVSYVIAYDPAPVKEALSFGGIYDGGKYLEKIVQVVYPIPRLSFLHCYEYIKKSINSALQHLDMIFDNPETQALEEILTQTDTIKLLKTPRDVIRVCNSLKVYSRVFFLEVSFTDLFLYHLLDTLYPAISTHIKNQPGWFVTGEIGDNELNTLDSLAGIIASRREKEKKIRMDILFEDESVQKYKHDFDELKSVLGYMFPYLSKDYPDEVSPKRMQNRDALLQVLQAGKMSFTFSAVEAKMFLENPALRPKIGEEHQGLDRFSYFLRKVFPSIPEANIQDPETLYDYLAEMLPKQTEGVAHEAECFSEFFVKILDKPFFIPTRNNILRTIVEKTGCLTFSEHVLCQYAKRYHIWGDDQFVRKSNLTEVHRIHESEQTISYEQLYDLIELWLETVRLYSETSDILTEQHKPIHIFWRWGQFNDNDYSEVQDHVWQKIADPDWLNFFLAKFERSSGMMPSYILDFIADNEAFLDLLKKQKEHSDLIAKWADEFPELIASTKENEETER